LFVVSVSDQSRRFAVALPTFSISIQSDESPSSSNSAPGPLALWARNSLMTGPLPTTALGSSVYSQFPPAKAFGGAARSVIPCPAAHATCTTPVGGWVNENV